MKNGNNNPEVGKQLNKERRNALLGVAAGASIVAWHKPIISSVMLPAHAQTSTATSFFGANVSANPVASANSLLDIFVPEATAGVAMTPDEYTVSIEPIGTDGAAFTISLFEDLGETQGFSLAQVVYSGEVSVASGGSLSPTDNPCNLTGLMNIDVEITSVAEDAVDINLTSRSQSLTVPAGDGTLPTPMCTDGPEPLSFRVEGFMDNSVQVANNSLIDVLVPEAHAGEVISFPGTTYTILAEETSGGSGRFSVTLLESIENPRSQIYSLVESTFSGMLDGPGTGTLDLLTAGCDDAPMGSINAEIESVSDTELVMTLDSGETGPITLTPGSIMIPAPQCEEEVLEEEEQPE